MGFTFDEDDQDKIKTRAAGFVRWLETATARTVGLGGKHFARDARYQGPLYDLHGRDEVVRMFIKRFDEFQNYRFKVRSQFLSEDGRTLYLRWDMAGTRKGHDVVVSGMSETMFDMDARVSSHIDYYDPVRSFWFALPLVGGYLKSLYRKSS